MFLSINLFGLPLVAWLVIASAFIGLIFVILTKTLNAREISVVAVLVSTCLASNYALIWLPNVKVMDLIVFVSGLHFGTYVGGMVGILVWAIYGSINPRGFVMPIWLGCMAAESLFGIVGGMIGRPFSVNAMSRRLVAWEMAVTGFLLTFTYDLATNLLSAVTISWFETSLETIVAVMISGVPFALIHELSNAILFFLGVGPLDSSIEKIAGGRFRVTR